jgi:hypothetical protein
MFTYASTYIAVTFYQQAILLHWSISSLRSYTFDVLIMLMKDELFKVATWKASKLGLPEYESGTYVFELPNFVYVILVLLRPTHFHFNIRDSNTITMHHTI